jgi:PhoD-like phosphatase
MSASWLASGALSDTGATVAAKVDASTSTRLVVSTAAGLTSPTYSAAVVSDANGLVKLPITGLTVDTQYYYGVEIGGVLDAIRGQFKTAPVAAGAAASFTFAFSSCNVSTSAHKVFNAMRTRAPLFFAHLGDRGYFNITTDDQAAFRGFYDNIFASSAEQTAFYKAIPSVYTWDDHDFGGDNSDGTSASAPAAQAVYRQANPHYPLAVADAIYHSFRIGRAYFIVTDLRSFRSVDSATDNSSKTMMGATQKTWFKAELLAAKAAGAAVIFWLCSSPWPTTLITGIDADKDHYAAFTTERTELADYIKANNIANLVILNGDSHSMGYAEGPAVDFATSGGAPVPVLLAGALEQTQNVRSGAWSVQSGGDGQYGYVNVTDDGRLLSWDFHAIRVDITTGVETELFKWVPTFHNTNAPLVASGTLVRDWDAATLAATLKPGARVTAWVDRANADSLAQATVDAQPTYRLTDAGYPAVNFSRAHLFSTAYDSSTNPTTIVVIARRKGHQIAEAGHLIDGNSSTTRRRILFNNVAGSPVRFAQSSAIFSGPAVDDQFHVFTMAGGAVNFLGEVDGVLASSFPGSATQPLTGIRVGARYDGTQQVTGAEIARILIYQGEVSAADRTVINNWAIATYLRGSGLFVADRGNWVPGRLNPVAA